MEEKYLSVIMVGLLLEDVSFSFNLTRPWNRSTRSVILNLKQCE